MSQFELILLATHVGLAVVLFFAVNWIGKHAVDFGYTSTTLFEEANESVALNFFIRALSPAVFIIALSAILVSTGHPSLRFEIYRIAIYYYLLRALVIFLLNRQRLISWPRFIGHALIGIAAAVFAYRYLIAPNRSLIPNMENAGNEVWLAILAFLYAVANKVPLPGGPGARRRNSFITIHYREAVANFGPVIDAKITDDLLKLITYSIIVFEDYARPPTVRLLERMMFWKADRTTGIMQVSGPSSFSDAESVDKGTDILVDAWNKRASDDYIYTRLLGTIAEYNADDDYVTRVTEVMEIIAKRVEPAFKAAYESVYGPE